MSIQEAAERGRGQGIQRASGRGSLILCYGGMAAIAIVINLPPVYLTTFSQAFGGSAGLSDRQLGLIGALIFAGLVGGLLISGPLADRWGPRTFVLIGSGLIGGGMALVSAASSYASLLLAAGVMGVGAGVMDMILSPIVVALRPGHRTAALNWLHAFYSIGAVLSTLLAAQVIRLSVRFPVFSWRTVFLVLALIPAGVLLGFARAPIPPLVSQDNERMAAGALLSRAAFWAAMVTMMLAGATELGMAQWLPLYAEKGLGYPRWIAGLALTVFSLVMAIGRLAGGCVSRHIRPSRLLVACCSACAVLYLLGAFCPWRHVALAACVLIGLTVSVLWPTTLGVTSERFPHGGATLFALLAAFGNAGGVAGLAIGSVADRHGLHGAIGVVAICPILMMLLLPALRRAAPLQPLV